MAKTPDSYGQLTPGAQDDRQVGAGVTELQASGIA